MTDAFSSIQYPHWLMMAGALLLVTGFLGLALRGRSVAETESDPEASETQSSHPEANIAGEPSERMTSEKRRDRWAERFDNEVAGR